MEQIENIKKFSEGFFKSLNAETVWSGEILLVKNVPESFEKFYGKKSPYNLIFEKDSSTEGEFVGNGSFILNCMKEFLENKGQSTIIKIKFDFNSEEEINRNFYLKNCLISNISRSERHEFIEMFTFLTVFQYLNEKEQLVNQIYIKDGKIIDFNIEKYQTADGKKEDLESKEMREDYNIAKAKVREIIEPKIVKIGEMLDKKLEKEVARIKNHYSAIVKENDGVKKESEEKIEQTKKEEKFLIDDEERRHALGVNTKLINTAIIYYPIYKFGCFLKNDDSARATEFIYDPMEKEFNVFNCNSCKREIRELNLCAGGHLSCEHCLRFCESCRKNYCMSCLDKTCYECGRRLCRKCAARCLKCGKTKCRSHMATSSVCEKCATREKAGRPVFRF